MTTDLQQERGFDDVVRDNKIPLTLIGIGAVWLLVGNTGLRGYRGNSRGGSILGPDGKPVGRTGEDHDTNWVDQTADAATTAITSVREAASAVVGQAGSASKFVGRTSNQVSKRLATDPWLIGVAGLVVGVVLAAMVPFTRVEQDHIGEARDDLLKRAQQLGYSAAERVRELAENRTSTAAQ